MDWRVGDGFRAETITFWKRRGDDVKASLTG